MTQDYLKKVITFEGGKLLCDGLEISIADAEKIVQFQVRALEDSTADYIQSNPELERLDIDSFAETVNMTRMGVSSNKIKVRGLDQYYDVAKDILKGIEVCDHALKFFSMKNKPVVVNKDDNKLLNMKWSGNVNNYSDYDPSIQEITDAMIDLFFSELISTQFKKQFNNSDLIIGTRDIDAIGSLDTGINIFIRVNDIDIYFKIDENEGKIDNKTVKFIASELRVGEHILQIAINNISKNSNNNLKTAQTLDNIVIKEIRFLKNTIKQEIDFSLAQSISGSRDRLELANFFVKNYGLLIDKKTKKKLDNIIQSSEQIIRERKKTSDSSNLLSEQFDLDVSIEKVDLDLDIKALLIDSISQNFDLEKDKVTINIKQMNENIIIYEIFISGQKILITSNNEQVSVTSSNTIGTGKTDFHQSDIYGNNLIEKLKNAAFLSSIPLLNRQVENIANNIKGKEEKKYAKEIENIIKNILNLLIDNSQNIYFKIDKIRGYFLKLLDNTVFINSKLGEGLFEIIDKIIAKINLLMLENLKLEYNYGLKVEDTYKKDLGILS
ncbi:MAG: hypothetical protein H7263_16120, partial [Candidatus Sericytochromatia bacterium]|nr:hypothetical protein [Candidatus Sericytochromatia bacterium]